MDPVNPLVTGRVRCTTAARMLGISCATISRLKNAGIISNTGHGYCIFEEVDKYLKSKQKIEDEVWMEKMKRAKQPRIGLDQVGIRARRVTHPNPIFDNGDRY